MTLSLKSSLAAAIVATGALAGSLAPAAADSIWFGPSVGIGPIGIGVGVGIGLGHGPFAPGYYGHGYYGHAPYRHAGAYGTCTKGEALGRAATMGVRKRWVSGLTDHRITVKGTRHGQPVEVVMYRNSADCAVKRLSRI